VAHFFTEPPTDVPVFGQTSPYQTYLADSGDITNGGINGQTSPQKKAEILGSAIKKGIQNGDLWLTSDQSHHPESGESFVGISGGNPETIVSMLAEEYFAMDHDCFEKVKHALYKILKIKACKPATNYVGQNSYQKENDTVINRFKECLKRASIVPRGYKFGAKFGPDGKKKILNPPEVWRANVWMVPSWMVE
jgi:hypothetical protein